MAIEDIVACRLLGHDWPISPGLIYWDTKCCRCGTTYYVSTMPVASPRDTAILTGCTIPKSSNAK